MEKNKAVVVHPNVPNAHDNNVVKKISILVFSGSCILLVKMSSAAEHGALSLRKIRIEEHPNALKFQEQEPQAISDEPAAVTLQCEICKKEIAETHDIVRRANCKHLYHLACLALFMKTGRQYCTACTVLSPTQMLDTGNDADARQYIQTALEARREKVRLQGKTQTSKQQCITNTHYNIYICRGRIRSISQQRCTATATQAL